MSVSTPFIRRPVGTSLFAIAIALAGIIAFFLLPVAPLPQTDSPTINVSAGLPGASPETMASSVATPLERQLGRIAGIAEMTSSSTLGSTSISLVFDLDRDIDAAARDVQAAINSAASQLPSNLPSKPSYRKSNPGDAPILILAMTSDVYPRGKMYDIASSILQQKISQVDGVGSVGIGGSSLPAVRVELNPTQLNNMGLALDDVRTALAAANANRPKGSITGDRYSWSLATTDQLFKASEYEKLVIAYRNGAPIHLSDIATVTDSVENIHTGGVINGKAAVIVFINREPGANIIETADRIIALMPQLQAALPAGMHLGVAIDRTTTIRASVHDVEIQLILSVILVVLVVFVFLRSVRTTFIPSVVVPISLLGTMGVMYLLGFSLDNLSLMAMTIATGFVVDDAIVVIENISRYLEQGLSPMNAAIRGASEIGFTVISISISLVAVFIPILLMSGQVGRLFREFAITLSVAIGISMVLSLTATPMMCAVLLRSHRLQKSHGFLYRMSERGFDLLLRVYDTILRFVLRHSLITLLITILTAAVSIGLAYEAKNSGDLFPVQDTGRLTGSIIADQATSSDEMARLLVEFQEAAAKDPAVTTIMGFSPGGTTNTARVFVGLKPLNERKDSAQTISIRLNNKLSNIPGAVLRLAPIQDLRFGGRQSNLPFLYAIQGDNFDEVYNWAPKILEGMRKLPSIAVVDTDQQTHGAQTFVDVDRATASRLHITAQAIDSALYGAFGQAQVSTMYTALNQYHVVMEATDRFNKDPSDLKHIYVRSTDGNTIPLSTFARFSLGNAPLSVAHQSQFPCVTLSFNTKTNVPLQQAVDEIENMQREMGIPQSIHGSFAGTAQIYQQSIASVPFLIVCAIVAVYIILGILYESLIHPITILSTIPSAGIGALLALRIFNIPFSIIALIGIFLLIGIVKKNAIIMIDFAIAAERNENKTPREAIFQAAILRFRPITMTTMAALLGAFPLAMGKGVGGELRQPLGVAIVGGLIFSQALTLFTTPVVYLYMDRLRLWLGRRRASHPTTTALALRT